MLTREEAMQKAIKEAKEFCNKFDIAPYGNTFSEFRTITTQEFFTKIYNNDHEAQLKAKDNEISALKAQQTALYDILKSLQKQHLYDVLYRSDK